MIQVKFYKNINNVLYGFKVKNHGDSYVCAAVSALVLNTVNCIEHFTDAVFNLDYKEEGGYISFSVPSIKMGEHCLEASLLLNSLEFGLKGISAEYPESVKISVITPS